MAATSSPVRARGAVAAQRAPSLTYVYAVLPAGEPAATALGGGHLIGIDGAPVRAVEHQGLIAAVGDVPAAQFDEGPLNDLLRDLNWLGPRAEAHQAVNAQLAALSDASLPLAFG